VIPRVVCGGIEVKHGSVCFLFGPRNPLVRYRVKPGYIGAFFGHINHCEMLV